MTRDRQQINVSLPALLGTIILHVGVMSSLLGAVPPRSTTRPPPTMEGGAQGALMAQNAAPMTVIFFDPPRSASRGFQQPSPPVLTTVRLSVEAGDPDPISFAPPAEPTDAVDEVASDQKPSDAASQHAKLFGRYMGQITARVERTWIKPRESIEGGAFACRVTITQDAAGKVKQVNINACNQSTRWQQSLVRAIESAAPLPAPPDPEVFTSTFNLAFVADTFSPGGRQEGFESEAQATTASEESHAQLQRFIDSIHSQRRPDPGVTELHLVGPSRPSPGVATP